MRKIFTSHKLVGLVFLALLAGGVWLTGAIFTKKFTDYDKVTLESSTVGLSLPSRADVKIRGVLVGEVLDTKVTKDGAELVLGLYPDRTSTIPRNVTARIEPKTLFGEKYVALQVPDAPDGSIRAGDRITQTVVATEVEAALNDLYPLLRTVQPQDLAHTLNAVASALEGRGEGLGRSLETLDRYLRKMNPQLPELVEDIKLTSEVAGVYEDVMPEIADILRGTVTTANTLLEREDDLNKLFKDVARFSAVTGAFLDKNEQNLVRVAQLSSQQLKVLGKYAPGFPCLVSGVVNAGKAQAEAFRGFQLHINLEVIPNQPRAYDQSDRPVLNAKNGPHCGQLPNPSYNQGNRFQNPPNFDDGVNRGTGKGTMRTAPGFEMSSSAGSSEETDLARGLVGAQLGQDADDVSDLGVLLYAPMLRGTEVSVQ
ncbi:MCE family protein [Nocardioides alcanivorans]|uniref:MCE family protein n=1 Tax=Nocardioides alcanivorans TaxID=2897352 RepID=UPI001F235A1F|nr:MCE family protein [Nocardioides alcanivorans]